MLGVHKNFLCNLFLLVGLVLISKYACAVQCGSSPDEKTLDAKQLGQVLQNKCDMVGCPVITSIGNNGKLNQIVDTDFVATREIQNSMSDGRFIAKFLDNSTWTTGYSKHLICNGAIDLIKGVGEIGAGTVIVTCLFAGATGRFLVSKMYTGTSALYTNIWSHASRYYYVKKLEYELNNL